MDVPQGRCRDAAARRRMRAAVVVVLLVSWMLLAATAPPALAAPTVTLSGPPSPTSDPTPEFTFSSDSATATLECSMDGGAFAACTSPFTPATSLGEGPHTFTARATDATGTGEQAATFTVDTTSPVVTIDSAPPDPTSSTSATFVFSGTDNVSTPDKLTFQCRLDFRPLEPCSSPKEYTGLSAGQHTVRVRATDEAGNFGALAVTWTVDLTPPETILDSAPPDPTNNPTPEFRFSSDDLSASFECSVDAQAFGPCLSPFTPAQLSDGSHTFAVRAVDIAGNADPSPAIVAFTVATGSPPPPADSTPPPSSSSSSPASSGDAPVSTSTAPARIATSFVLIAKRTIRVTRRRLAPITLNCAGSRDCAGVVRLTTARPVRTSAAVAAAQVFRKRRGDRRRRRGRAIRRVVRLGSARFVLPARTTAQIKIRLSKKRYRLVKRLKRVKVVVTVTDRDGAGRVRIGTREIFLRAR